MPRLLTVRKQAWVDRRKPNVLQGDAIIANAAPAIRYNEKLDSLIRRMIAEVEVSMRRLYAGEAAEQFFAEDASVSSQARIVTNLLLRKYNGLFGDNSRWVAEAFAGQVDRASSKSVHMSIAKLSGGLSLPVKSLDAPLKEIIKASVEQNVSLIKSIPQKYLDGVQQAVYRSITTGNGLQDLIPYLEKHKDITYARAKMIAGDQNRKIMQDMSMERVKRLGVTHGTWLHIPSNQPRHTHVEMHGKVFDLNEGLYDSAVKRFILPGELINCHCGFRPAIDFTFGG